MTGHKQTTDGTAYTTGYTYNLSGALIEETYPSGRVVKNVLDNNGDLAMVESKKNSASGFWSYADSFTYNATGAVTSMQLGNGRWESTVFNSRLQPTQIGLGTTPAAIDKLQLDYTYGTTANNGNVQTQKITVKRSGQSDLVFDQTYTYDELNRLKIAEEKTGTTTNWKQTFTFDRYGNRRFDQANTTFPASFSNPNVTNPTFNTANNRFASGQTWAYDAAGNVTTDAESRTLIYDAENKQVEAKNSSNASLGTYFFDGDGKRVKKVVPSTGETTVFVYDAGGKLIAEYSTNVVPAQDAKVQYLTNDNLGTPRINTDRDGNITSRSDYMPYGEEIVSLGGRSSTDKYVADDVRQGFTGYENDAETGLDFAQARMYVRSLGRFHSPDEPFADQYEDDPQSWNLYIYVMNNPLMFTDPSGLWKQVDCSSGQCWEAEDGDTFTSLAKILDIGVKFLTQFFADVNPNNIAIGQTFDVSGYDYWSVGSAMQSWPGDAHFDRDDPKLVQNIPREMQPDMPTGNPIKDGMRDFRDGAIDGAITFAPIPLPSKILVLGRLLKLSKKILGQGPARGWTKKMIQEAVEFGEKVAAPNRINPGNGATRYIHPTTGQSVVIDNVTNEIIHVGAKGFRY